MTSPSPSLSELGTQVRVARKEAGLRQADVAEAAGVSRFTVIKLERGQLADINYKTLVSILSALNLAVRLETERIGSLPILGE